VVKNGFSSFYIYLFLKENNNLNTTPLSPPEEINGIKLRHTFPHLSGGG
jgi:hypothetical protein